VKNYDAYTNELLKMTSLNICILMAHHEREVADLVRVHPPKMANQRSWIR
jgi:hypothetical protein